MIPFVKRKYSNRHFSAQKIYYLSKWIAIALSSPDNSTNTNDSHRLTMLELSIKWQIKAEGSCRNEWMKEIPVLCFTFFQTKKKQQNGTKFWAAILLLVFYTFCACHTELWCLLFTYGENICQLATIFYNKVL